MPDLFSPYTLKDVTLRNRIAMSPMTMYRSVDGKTDDFHLMYLGARAAGGFGLIFPEQVAIAPEGRTTPHCAGIYDDVQIEGHARVTSMIKGMGAVAGIQLGHTGRNGSEVKPWVAGELGRQLARTTRRAGRSSARRTFRTASANGPTRCTRCRSTRSR